jgi:hypothetical protein
MHVKVSGTISRVSQIWSKVSGTWTRNTAALIKTNPVTIYSNSYDWTVDYLLKPNLPSGTYVVTGTFTYGLSYGIINGTRYYCAPGSHVLRTTVTLGPASGNWASWYNSGGSQEYCTFDGQAVTYPYSGHYHYAGNTTHTITTPPQTFSTTPAGAGIGFVASNGGANSTLIEQETAVWKVG